MNGNPEKILENPTTKSRKIQGKIKK